MKHASTALVLLLAAGCAVRTMELGDVTADASLDVSPDACGLDGGCGESPCYYDEDCAAPELRCDDETHTCIPAAPCQDLPHDPTDGPPTCAVSEEAYDYCRGTVCRCVASARAQSPFTGFCKRPLPPCAPCERDEQCGDDPDFFDTGWRTDAYCVRLEESDPTGYCLERFTTATRCPCGRALDREGRTLCAPQELSACRQGGVFTCCERDADCPEAHPICDVARGVCRDSCAFDFERGETVGCRADLVCNVDPALLVESRPDYGAGACAPPCANDSECQAISPVLRCIAERDGRPRCRPQGCLDDLECAPAPVDSAHESFCDRARNQCVCDASQPENGCYCRGTRPGTNEPWVDPVTRLPYSHDCRPGYRCSVSGERVNQCVKETCAEEGGAALACRLGEFCCGEDRNQDGATADDACVLDRAGSAFAEPGMCYPAPRDVYCARCEVDGECQEPGFPAQATPPQDPNRCLPGGAAARYCRIACTRLTECPAGFGCLEEPVSCLQGDSVACGGHPERCTEPSQSQPGGSATARCACSTPYASTECPAGTRCSSEGGYCVYGQFCTPPAGEAQSWCEASEGVGPGG